MKILISFLIFIIPKFSFTQYTNISLSQKTNYYINKDIDQKLWISSNDGINVYDGNKVKIYTPDKYKLIGSNIQSAFLEDCDHHMWFSTYNALHKYDRQIDDFIPYQFIDKENRIIDINYKLLAYDRHFLFFKFGKYFGIFDINTNQLIKKMSFPTETFQEFSIHIIEQKILLACQNENQIQVWKCNDFMIDTLCLTNSINVINNRNIQLINHQYLFYDSDNAIHQYEIQKHKDNTIIQSIHKPHDFEVHYNGIYVLTSDSLYLYHCYGQIKYSEKITSHGKASHMHIIDGDLWYNEDGIGIHHQNLNKKKFNYFSLLKNGFNARGLIQDSKGRYWCTSRVNGICQFNNHGQLIKHYSPRFSNAKNYPHILNLTEESDGTILGASQYEIIKYNEIKNDFDIIPIIHLDKDRFYGNLLSTGNGIVIENWSNATQTYILDQYEVPYTLKVLRRSSLINNEFLNLRSTSTDSIFFSIDAKDLGIGVIANDTLRILNTYKVGALFNNYYQYKGKYYFAFSNGLYVMNGNKLVKIRDTDGLLDQNIYSILAHNEILYLSSNSGLLSYNLITNSAYQFTMSDGLQEKEYNNLGALKDREGNFWFAGVAGLNKFHPDQLQFLTNDAAINISELRINGMPSIFYNKVANGEELILDYEDNTIEIKFNGIDYADLSNVMLKYKLEPYDHQWTVLENDNGYLRYPNLPPGKYTLLLNATNADRIWNKLPKHIDIEIIPPFYMTWWFYLLAALSSIGIMNYAYEAHYRRKEIKQKQLLREQSLIIEKQNAVERERYRIASEMHDDLGSGLTSIKYLSDTLMSKLNFQELDELKRIANHSRQLVNNMSEIIWAMNSRFDNIDSFTSYLRRYASEFLDEHKIEIQFNNDIEQLDLNISGEKRRNLYLVCKELLHNAVKYSGSKKICIHMSYYHALLNIHIIEYEGIGFDYEAVKEKSNGLYNIEKRLQSIDGNIAYSLSENGMHYSIQCSLESNQ